MGRAEVKGLRHIGRLSQIYIYLGKLLRMFVFQSGWMVIPMAAAITEIVCIAISGGLFINMEGTSQGAFAVACVCIWDGMFNSIQVICRERAIIKREHRSGLHMSSYVIAHMLYQAILCAGQAGIMLWVMRLSGVTFPKGALLTGNVMIDIFITLFLISYAADIMALFVSSLVKNPTTAMTVVPFLLILQLVFSGSIFSIKGNASMVTEVTISKWGINALCAQGHYNDLPMTSVWRTMRKMRNVEVDGKKPIGDIVEQIEEDNKKEELMLRCGKENYQEKFASTKKNLLNCYGRLLIFTGVFALCAVISLEFIDKDKR